jgi:GT2 family glycosyltransferase
MSPKAAPWVTVLVLNWNGKVDTLECLESLSKLTYKNRDIVVVDNGSSDGSAHAIAAGFPSVTLLQTGCNLGFAGGNNVGLRHVLATKADFVFILNNDTLVRSNVLEILLHEAEQRQGRAIVGALMLSTDPLFSVQFAGSVWEPDLCSFRSLQGKAYLDPSQPETIPSAYTQGSAVLIPIPAIRHVGLFDERFFLMYEDSDWCYRARNYGYECLIATRATVWHKESPSFGGKESPLYLYFVTRNRLLWTEIHIGWRGVLGVVKRLYWMMSADFIEYRRQQSNDAARARFVRSLLAFLRQPRQIAMFIALRDYAIRRFGNCPAMVRRMKS